MVWKKERLQHSWTPNKEPISFPKDKTWLDYIKNIRIEISCGEAPYLVSRYDTTNGEAIPLDARIGLLDRKLRVICENTKDQTEWLDAAKIAYKSIYAYEWQGDNLLLAREALLYSFIEYFKKKFKKLPAKQSTKCIANIISWNIWQMDGIKGVIPNSCHDDVEVYRSFFGDDTIKRHPCDGCQHENIYRHNGIYCLIKDWTKFDKETNKPGKVVRFVDLLRN